MHSLKLSQIYWKGLKRKTLLFPHRKVFRPLLWVMKEPQTSHLSCYQCSKGSWVIILSVLPPRWNQASHSYLWACFHSVWTSLYNTYCFIYTPNTFWLLRAEQSFYLHWTAADVTSTEYFILCWWFVLFSNRSDLNSVFLHTLTQIKNSATINQIRGLKR